METLSPIGRHEVGGFSRTSMIAAAGIIFLLGTVTPVTIRTARDLVRGTNSVTGDLPSAPSQIDQKAGRSLQSALLPKSRSVGDGFTSTLKSFADEVNILAERSSNSPNSFEEDWEEIAPDFLHKTNIILNMFLRDVNQDVAGVKLDICTRQCERQQWKEGDKNDVEEENKTFLRQEQDGEPSGHGIHAIRTKGNRSTDSNKEYNAARVPNANQPRSPASGGILVHPANDSAGDDGVSSALKSFAGEAKAVADEYERTHLDSTSHSVEHGREQIAKDFIQFLLRKLALDVADVNLDIAIHQGGRQQSNEDENVTVNSLGKLAGKPSTRLGIHVEKTRERSDPDLEAHRSTITRVLEESSYDEGEDEDGHKINARFAKLPTETCIRCCPKEKGGHRRTTNQVEEDVRLADEFDDHHREAWIAPSWVQSCAICCDDDDDDHDEPTTCPPVPAPAPCPTPPPTVSCPEPVPCPTPPPTTTMPTTLSPTPDTCIEPLEELEDFIPECGSNLTRTYYRVRTFTVPEDCEVFTNGPLVVESVNTTIQGSLIGTGQGSAGASGCFVSSDNTGICTSSEGGQGSGGGASGLGGGDAGGGGGYGGKGGDSGARQGGPTYEDLLPGSGGGAGVATAEGSGATSGSGGNGGGLVSFLTTDSFVLGANAMINFDGDDGGNGASGGSASAGGGGGGGSGGGVDITACTAMIEGTITASGGRGGNGRFAADGGGGGGGGRIRITTETPSDVTGPLIVNGGDGGTATLGFGGDPGTNGTVTSP